MSHFPVKWWCEENPPWVEKHPSNTYLLCTYISSILPKMERYGAINSFTLLSVWPFLNSLLSVELYTPYCNVDKKKLLRIELRKKKRKNYAGLFYKRNQV